MKAKIRITTSLNLSIGALCVLISGLAGATPVVNYDAGGHAIGISDLTVSGNDYDVSFVFGSYDSVFGTTDPTFLGDPTGANAAADAIGAAMNAEATSPTIGKGASSGVVWTVYSVDVPGDRYFATQVGYQPSPWRRFSDFTDNLTADRSTEFDWAFAVFTPVPEPATLSLLGLALAGAAVARRRRLRG